MKHQSIYRIVLSASLALMSNFFFVVLCHLSSRRESYLPFLDTLRLNQMELEQKYKSHRLVPNHRIVSIPFSIKHWRPEVSGKAGVWIIVLKVVLKPL